MAVNTGDNKMATYTRANAWNNGGTLAGNPDLFWYAVGVGVMMKRSITDTRSWWYFAAIHGDGPGWASITGRPAVPPLPSPDLQGWNQCQHATWYFPPWHRGYVMALESQVRADIVAAGGPSTWALPYWNYFDPNQFDIPPAFMQQTFPATGLSPNVPAGIAGSPNPLYVSARYGPKGDGVVFVPSAEARSAHPQDPSSDFALGTVTDGCMSDHAFTDSFGGGVTGFEHFDSATGDLENNPHNLVHSYVGGFQNNNQANEQGLMGDPIMAGLDPIFYLHHCNIDRMWAVWNVTLGNANPNDPNWLHGPTTNGQPDFQMPYDGTWRTFTPSDVTDLTQLNYTYQEMSAPADFVTSAKAFSARLTALGAALVSAPIGGAPHMTPSKVELIGATQGMISVKGSGARTPLRLDKKVRSDLVASLAAASSAKPPDRVFLRLDNIVGTTGGVLSVYINLPEAGKPSKYNELCAGSVGLFGLRQASQKDGKHAGKGMSFTLDITKVVDYLHLNKSLDADALSVSLVPL
jgi:tyrosinase